MTEINNVCESILQEAQRLTHGDRNKDYGHPLDDYTKNAGIINALFAHKLREPFTAAEVALIMVGVKLSRQVNRPKRDNMVDAAGYAWVANACIEETARRAELAAHIKIPRIHTSFCEADTDHSGQCVYPAKGAERTGECVENRLPAGADSLAKALYRASQESQHAQAAHYAEQKAAPQERQCGHEPAPVHPGSQDSRGYPVFR